jgi:hypothetical protein
VRSERWAGEASSLSDAQRIHEMLAPLDRTRAARLAMARKTRFIVCTSIEVSIPTGRRR